MDKYTNKLGTPSGFRDLLPNDAARREYMIEKITNVYKSFGFLPLETPIAEFEDIILPESASDFNLFRLESTNKRQGEGEKEEVALRFDLTIPLARVVSQYGNDLPRPFKRYQSGYVFRGERPQKGRYRQFMQFDADIVGTKSLVADTEMIIMINEVLEALEVKDFVIRVNTRTLLNTLPSFTSFADNLLREVLIILDKAEKISSEELVEELRRLRLQESTIKKISEFGQIFGKPREVISKLTDFFAGYEDAQKGIGELETLANNLESFSLGDKVTFDMKIIRGLGYYTGIVFETNLLQALEFGSVISGGRYDNLVERFTSQTIPAVGMSVGVDRLDTALATLGVLKTKSKSRKIVVISQGAPFDSYALSVASRLRSEGIIVDVYVGTKQDFKDIFSYAEQVGASFTVIVGEDEMKSQTINIRNLATREQKTVTFSAVSDVDFS